VLVIKDVYAHARMVGNPAKRSGWMRESGERLDNEEKCKEYGKGQCL